MVNKFVCKNGHHFNADDSKEVICPICLTTEVKVDTSSPLKTIIKRVGIIFALVLLLGGMIWGVMNNTDSDITIGYGNLTFDEQTGLFCFDATSNYLGKEEIVFELLAFDSDRVIKDCQDGHFTNVAPSKLNGKYKLRVFNEKQTKSATIEIDGFEENIAVELIINNPVLNSNHKYDLSVSATDKSAVSVYVLMKLFSDQEVVSSVHGSFQNIEPSEEADSYRVVAKLKNGKNVGPVQVSGFGKVENTAPEIVEPVEIPASTVQNWIDNDVDGTFVGANPKIASNVILHFIGLKKDDSAPKVLADVQNKIDMVIWSSVTVTDVVVDQRTGKVSEITFKVIY